MLLRCLGFILGLVALTGNSLPAEAELRYALVIGNGAYRGLSPLKNPTNDARLMARVLSTTLGFKVYGGYDLDRSSMLGRIEQFVETVRTASPGSVAMIYYAGHGMEVANENYLFPVDAIGPFARENVSDEAISLTSVIKELERTKSRIKVVILDACRGDRTRSASGGFRAIATPLGSIVVYSTAPGATAQDGIGDNSPFTGVLADLIQIPGLSAEEVLFKVQDQVYRTTQPPQIPWVKPNLNGIAFSFNPISDKPTPPRPVAAVPQEQLCETPRGPYRVIGLEAWDHLNVRGVPQVPSYDGRSISNVSFKLPPNARGIEIAPGSCAGGWCRIRHKCKEGWVHEKYIALSDEESVGIAVADYEASGEYDVRVPAGDVLYVREDPHHLAPIVTEIAAGEAGILRKQCTVPTGSKESWCYLTHQGNSGWANSRYLIRHGE